MKNLAACASVLLASCLARLRRAETAAEAKEEQEELRSRKLHGHPRMRAERQAQQARQAERQARYEQITALQKQGMKSAEIAAVVGMAERTVRHWLSRGDIPYSDPRKPRSSPLDPYKSYLLSRWHEGCHNGAQFERELRAKGYKGSQWSYRRASEPLKAHQTKYVWSSRSRSSQASRASPQPEESRKKEQEEASTTERTSQGTEGKEKEH